MGELTSLVPATSEDFLTGHQTGLRRIAWPHAPPVLKPLGRSRQLLHLSGLTVLCELTALRHSIWDPVTPPALPHGGTRLLGAHTGASSLPIRSLPQRPKREPCLQNKAALGGGTG